MVCLLGCAQERPERINLDAFERTVHSQHGEEGVLEKIFEIVPPTSKYAVEFGAWDGIVASNTALLMREQGWGGLLIEGHPRRAKKLAKNYADLPNVTTMHRWIFPGNIELLFEEAGVPKDLDLLIIDIDSNDYYVWRAIRDYRPKVVMIEANYNFRPPERAVVDFHPMNYWDRTNYIGASLQSLYELGKRKGYELVHLMEEGPNIIFVDEPYFDRFGIEDNSPKAMWRPRMPALSDPRVYPDDKKTLKIDAFEIEKKWVELPPTRPEGEGP